MGDEKKPRGLSGSAAKEQPPAQMLGLPARVKELREARGWTQDVLAEKAVVSQANVSKLESGDSLQGVRLVSVVRVAAALDVSLDELVLGIPDPWQQIAKAVERGRLSPIEAAPMEQGSEPVQDPGDDSSASPSQRHRPQPT